MSTQQNQFIDYYHLLNVSFNESVDKIKKSYRKIALKKHPDKNPNNPNAAQEFAILVEAKEILTNKEKRMKYDIEYKEYQQRLEQKKKDQLRMAEMDKHRQKMINDLNLREEMVMKQRQNEMYKNHHYHITQQRIKEEMERFRKELRNEESNRINKKLKEFERKKKDEKLKKRSLMIKLDKTQCHKPYSLKELESIFRSYGKIEDIHMNKQSKNKYGGAEIVFTKSKYVQNAFNDQKTLKKEFYLILIDNNRKNGSSKNNSLENKWRNFVNKRQKQYDYNQYNQYQAFVWNKVDQFINDNNACDKDNEETSASV